jgi:hypothetical protein
MAATISKPEGRKSDKLMRDAIRVALHRPDEKGTKYIARVAEALVNKAVEGDVTAIKEINDRMDGKAVQPIAGADAESPVKLVIEWARSSAS